MSIEKALSAVCPSASVALMVKLYVVSEVAPDSVPVIVEEPLPEFKLNPPGKEPDWIAIQVELVAVRVSVPTDSPPPKLPKLPAAVTHAGASETVRIAVPLRTALPSLFSTLIK